ncbi:MAG TPA: AraC family transcriptional regulator [Polyangiales bacterium]
MRALAPPSVLSSWTRVIVDALEALGIDPAPVLLEGGFAEDSFRDPNARLSALATARLWRTASERAADPAFGIHASRFVRPATFHALGYAVFASTSLRDALERLLRYSHLVSDAAELSLEMTPSEVRLAFVPREHAELVPGVPSAEALDAVMSLIVRTCRTLTDKSFSLKLLEQRRPTPASAVPYQRFFRCPVEFGAAEDALTFDASVLDRRLPTANPELARHNDDLVQRYLAGMREGTVVDRLRSILSQHLSADASPHKLAALLGMSSRSLQRRLQEHGTSYAQVLRDTRRDLAMSYLVQPQCSITEIAFLLGFEDASAFARAFRSWTGVTPSAFRSAQIP